MRVAGPPWPPCDGLEGRITTCGSSHDIHCTQDYWQVAGEKFTIISFYHCYVHLVMTIQNKQNHPSFDFLDNQELKHFATRSSLPRHSAAPARMLFVESFRQFLILNYSTIEYAPRLWEAYCLKTYQEGHRHREEVNMHVRQYKNRPYRRQDMKGAEWRLQVQKQTN